MRSELTKIRSVRSTYWALVVTVLVTVLIGAFVCAFTLGASSGARSSCYDPTYLSLVGLIIGQLVIAVLGALSVTSEYATGMIRTSLAVQPGRGTLFAAKATAFTLVSLAAGLMAAFTSFLLGQAILSRRDLGAALGQPHMLRAVVGAGLFLCASGLLAFGLGALLRSTAGAVTSDVGAATFPRPPPFLSLLLLSRCRDPVRACSFPARDARERHWGGREAGGPPPGAGSGGAGAGSDRLGDGRAGGGGVGEDDHPRALHRVRGVARGDPDDQAARGDEAGDELLPVGVLGALVPAVGDDHQDAGAAGPGEAERAVQGADGGGEVLVLAGGAELRHLGGDGPGVGDRADLMPVGDGRGAGGGQARSGAGQYPAAANAASSASPPASAAESRSASTTTCPASTSATPAS